VTALPIIEPCSERQRLLTLLDQAQARSRRIAFWWRDDDAETVTPALERLLALADRHSLPLALAVIPEGATLALAERLSREPRLAVLQHGWQHRNHSQPDQRKMEFGDHRPAEIMREELRLGFERLSGMFQVRFVPILVPPWNRIGSRAAEGLRAIGFAGLSTIGPAGPPEPRSINTHVDIFAWKPVRRPLTRTELYALVRREVERRLAGSEEPVGILTHHLVHDDASWALLDGVLSDLAHHPAASWPSVPDLFPPPD
jgi:hypothetical protein